VRRELPVVSKPAAWPESYGSEAKPRVGFFTDTTLCIGCKACEVACKQWNDVPSEDFRWYGWSHDNTGSLGADTWRHVAFIEQAQPIPVSGDGAAVAPDVLGRWRDPDESGAPATPRVSDGDGDGGTGVRWLMSSDVCKHCTDAACLDVCPTGALFRTELGTVVVQQDVCNGCGYCVAACPFGVIGRREREDVPGHGLAQKCTLCYDRTRDGIEPACAKACPTESIQFGDLEELRERAARRVDELHERGTTDARLYGADPDDGVGGFGAFFLLLDEPEVYGLPPDPVATTRHLPSIWGAAVAAAGALAAMTLVAVSGRRS